MTSQNVANFLSFFCDKDFISIDRQKYISRNGFLCFSLSSCLDCLSLVPGFHVEPLFQSLAFAFLFSNEIRKGIGSWIIPEQDIASKSNIIITIRGGPSSGSSWETASAIIIPFSLSCRVTLTFNSCTDLLSVFLFFSFASSCVSRFQRNEKMKNSIEMTVNEHDIAFKLKTSKKRKREKGFQFSLIFLIFFSSVINREKWLPWYLSHKENEILIKYRSFFKCVSVV